ncbi:MAG: hypothetical protein FWD67_12115 [Betaproteobacteria bacterium]|nr:hypothetical protein [Betaproteobacteria bacterium]
MLDEYKSARAAYDAELAKLAALKARGEDSRARINALRMEVEADEKRQKAEALEAVMRGDTFKADNTQIAAAKDEIDSLTVESTIMGDAINLQMDVVENAYGIARDVVSRLARSELEAVCVQLREVATPLLERALSLYPACHAWNATTASAMLESIGLHGVKPGGDCEFERFVMPYDVVHRPEKKSEPRPLTVTYNKSEYELCKL